MKKHSKYIIIRNTLLSLSGGVTVFIGVYAATLPESEGGWGGLFWSGMFAISLILFCFIAYGYTAAELFRLRQNKNLSRAKRNIGTVICAAILISPFVLFVLSAIRTFLL